MTSSHRARGRFTGADPAPPHENAGVAGSRLPYHETGAIIIHYDEPVDPYALPGQR